MKKACVFVDGENFSYSLKDLFSDARYTFRKGDYLPDTDWHHFLSSLANRFECELPRTYWYVVEHIDCRPYRIPTDWKLKERDLTRWYRERIKACPTEPERRKILTQGFAAGSWRDPGWHPLAYLFTNKPRHPIPSQ